MLRDGRRKPLSRLTIRHGQPARTLTLPSRRWIVPHLGGTIRRSAPGLTPPGPGSRQPFIDENIADIAAFDAYRRQGPAIAVGPLTQDFDPPTLQDFRQPDLRLPGKVGFMDAAALHFGSVDVEYPNSFGLLSHTQPDRVTVPDADFRRLAGSRAEQDGDDDMDEQGKRLS